MPRDRAILCPTCGALVPADPPGSGPSGGRGPTTVEVVMPATLSGTLAIDLAHAGSPLAPTEPEFAEVSPPPLGLPGPGGRSDEGFSGASGTEAPLTGPAEPDPLLRLLVAGERSRAEVADLPAPRHQTPSVSRDDDTPAADRPPNWPLVLLGSYASAVTMACLWLWWQTGRLAPPTPADPPVAEAVEGAGESAILAAQGLRGEASRSVQPLARIPEERRTEPGRPLRIDDLEVTPLRVERGPVTLERLRLDGRLEVRDGGPRALWLRLRLTNLSETAVFAPLDEAFVRDRDEDLPDSILEADDGRRLYAYALPVRSEWAIVGQPIRELRPGESIETALVAEDDPSAAGPLLWRMKLRTAPDRAEAVGVRFDTADIRPAPPRQRPAVGPAPSAR